ncbi:DNA/RNA non-specific endonuclease [Sphingomonas sp. BT-65]|uniref:DNA/RNA non-specific endonuclease n=1 Tax=Sphingomonas sp. BT-65 TaxID=2989821 RepID=UPI002236256F|nr:DNA/RNA non-specific endonuclease [Sphingomonas sp. BT-65]MCW4462927.1 DNA/RNA non-specific endonuclease [Sphingomonas sp. BT-65]
MLNKRVEDAQGELNAEARAYIEDKADEIQQRVDAAEREGPIEARPREEAIAHARHATVAEGRFEASVGSDDKAPVNFLERGMRASRAVCRLVDFGPRHLGTGFLVAPGLLITNNHVLPSADAAAEAIAEFGYELDADEQPLPKRRFLLEPERLFITSPQDQCDFTLVAVRPTEDGGPGELAAQGWLPMDAKRHKILEGQPTIVLQHPDGQMKLICLFESQCVFRDDQAPYILYTNDTDYGSSGSPVFNRYWQLVALHHAAIETGRMTKGRPELHNRGIRISAILKALETGIELSAGAEQAAAALELLNSPSVQGNGRPAAPTVLAGDGDGDATVLESRWTNVRVKPVGPREGYRADFLGGGDLAVPIDDFVPDWLESDVTPLLDGSGHVLNYQHFSIVMSMSRKLALFTAVNIDGSRMMALGRKDRDPDRPLEPGIQPEAASDKWMFDDRIAEADQLGPRLYDLSSFDFGHLVRRLDPVWAPPGDVLRTPRIANDDTFYMTNCSPQEERWHRLTPLTRDQSNWSDLEDLVLNTTNTQDRRVSVFTGPVLDPRDPLVKGVKIPRAFWKIVAFEQGGRLRSAGYLLWQTREVERVVIREAPYSFPASSGPTPLREIARLTGLDFGPLFDADIR